MFNKPVSEIIKARHSCRNYHKEPIRAEMQAHLKKLLGEPHAIPFNSKIRIELAAAEENDSAALKGLGTYGFIKNPAAFIIGAAKHSNRALEDYGYLMEKIILVATDMDLGTCWLGGSFQKSRFAEKISAAENEIVPAVVSTGYPAPTKRALESISRSRVGSDRRKPWEKLFFRNLLSDPLSKKEAGPYEKVLDMVRLAPSADNIQPWRIIMDEKNGSFHFYMQRSKVFGAAKILFRMADLQRIDMGIAMCHFELSAKEAGLKGSWIESDPGLTGNSAEYVISWAR
jgi:nitroreductase